MMRLIKSVVPLFGGCQCVWLRPAQV